MGRSAGRCALVVTCSVLGVACIWHAVLSLTCKRLGRSRRAISLNLSQHSPDKYMQGNRTRSGAGARGRRVPAERCTDARGDGGSVARMDGQCVASCPVRGRCTCGVRAGRAKLTAAAAVQDLLDLLAHPRPTSTRTPAPLHPTIYMPATNPWARSIYGPVGVGERC